MTAKTVAVKNQGIRYFAFICNGTWSKGIRKIWHDKKMRGRGVTEDRAKILIQAAHNSVGFDGGIGTKSELYMLLEEHRLWTSQPKSVNKVLEVTIRKVGYVENYSP